MIPSASSTFGRIGSGLTPPKYGLRSRGSRHPDPPAARSRGIQPAPAPYSGLDEDRDVGRLQRVEVDRPPDERS
jgi:hypothetical protein